MGEKQGYVSVLQRQAQALETVQHPFNEIQQLLVSQSGASQGLAGHAPDSRWACHLLGELRMGGQWE